MIRNYARRIAFLGAIVASLTLVIACGASEQQAAPQGKSAPQQPAAAAAAADPAQPVAPERKAPASDTSAGGFQTGAQAPDTAKPTLVAVPTDVIKRGGVLRQAHRRSPLHFRMDVRSATDETTASAPIFNQLLALQNPDFVNLGTTTGTHGRRPMQSSRWKHWPRRPRTGLPMNGSVSGVSASSNPLKPLTNRHSS